jgi:hypothetical protein
VSNSSFIENKSNTLFQWTINLNTHNLNYQWINPDGCRFYFKKMDSDSNKVIQLCQLYISSLTEVYSMREARAAAEAHSS